MREQRRQLDESAAPKFFDAVDDTRGLVNKLAESPSASAAIFEQRRETPSQTEARERRETRARLAVALLDEGKVGWHLVGATQHFFGVDGMAIGSDHKMQITLDGKPVKLTLKPRSEHRACESCKQAAQAFTLGFYSNAAAYGRADDDAVLSAGTKPKKVERVRGFQI